MKVTQSSIYRQSRSTLTPLSRVSTPAAVMQSLPVMGPDHAAQPTTGEFSDKIPPRFDGHADYAVYREDISLWTNLTSLPRSKHGPAMIGRLTGEAKTAAKTVPSSEICSDDGVAKILARLDKAYAIDQTNRLDIDLAEFLDYSWNKNLSVEHFISGFHTRVDKISELNLNDKLKGHLLLRQADLAANERHVVIGASSGSYNVGDVSAALRNIYRNSGSSTPATHRTSSQNNNPINDNDFVSDREGGGSVRNRRRGRGRGRRNRLRNQNHDSHATDRPNFYSFKTADSSSSPGVIIDTGASSSVVGKTTLDNAMTALGLDRVEDVPIKQRHHRFGNHDVDQPSLFAVKMTFQPRSSSQPAFDVSFDVIDGDLPFLLGLPSLMAMGATLNHKYLSLSLSLRGKYERLRLVRTGDHISLPFRFDNIIIDRQSPPRRSEDQARSHYRYHRERNSPTSHYSTSNNRARQDAPFATATLPHASSSDSDDDSFAPDDLASSDGSAHLYEVDDPRSSSVAAPPSSKPFLPATHDGYYCHHGSSSSATDAARPTFAYPGIMTDERSHAAMYCPRSHRELQDRQNTIVTCGLRSTDPARVSALGSDRATHRRDSRGIGKADDQSAVAHEKEPSEQARKRRSAIETNCTGEEASDSLGAIADRPREVVRRKRHLEKADIRKIHLQLRHASRTSMLRYIKLAGITDKNVRKMVDAVVSECPCNLALPPKPHSKISARPPSDRPQERISIDVIHLEGRNYLHAVDESSRWSEAGHICSKAMRVQIDVLYRMQHLRHGSPKFIRCDREYFNSEFRAFCDQHQTELIAVAANDHESNGAIENANKTLRNYFNRLRLGDRKSHADRIVAEAIYGKNVAPSGELCSSFELIYRRRPRVDDDIDERLPAPVTNKEHAARAARRKLDKMIRTPLQHYDNIRVGDLVAIWRDASGWLSPCRVIRVTPFFYEVIHNGRVKTSGISRTRIVQSQQLATESECRRDEIEIDAPNIWNEEGDWSSDPDSYAQQTADDRQPIDTSTDTPHAETFDQTSPRAGNRVSKSEVDRINREAQSITGGELGSRRSITSTLISRVAEHDDAGCDNAKSCDRTVYADAQPKATASDSASSPLTNEERIAAFNIELRKWEKRNAHSEVDAKSVDRRENIIGSHVAYRRKLDGTAKARIVPWGHRDRDKDYLRGDAPSVSFDVFRLIMSLAAEHRWEIGQIDIEAAYLQAQGFVRTIYVRPPREAQRRDKLWKLNAAAYGLTDSGRLWYLTSNNALIEEYGLSRSRLDYSFYFALDADERLCFALAVQVDDYIYCGTPSQMTRFEAFLREIFDVGKFIRRNLDVMGCSIRQNGEYEIVLSQSKMLDDLAPDDMLQSIDSPGDRPATSSQATEYRRLIGKMMFVGRMSSPVMQLHASIAATKLNDLMTHHLRALATVLRRLKRESATLTFKPPPPGAQSAEIDIISDGATASSGNERGREGFILLRRWGDIIHPVF